MIVHAQIYAIGSKALSVFFTAGVKRFHLLEVLAGDDGRSGKTHIVTVKELAARYDLIIVIHKAYAFSSIATRECREVSAETGTHGADINTQVVFRTQQLFLALFVEREMAGDLHSLISHFPHLFKCLIDAYFLGKFIKHHCLKSNFIHSSSSF